MNASPLEPRAPAASAFVPAFDTDLSPEPTFNPEPVQATLARRPGLPPEVERAPRSGQRRTLPVLMGLCAALLVALGATAARADNHFLLEGELGGAGAMGNDAEGELGLSYGGTFGFGGRVKGFAPAYYLVAHLASNEYGFTGPARAGSAEVDRTQVEYSIGGRIYLPLNERLRIVLQVGFGQVFDQSTLSRFGHEDLRLESDAFIVQTLGGLQYRLNDTLSLGGAADFAFMPDKEEIDAIARAAGVKDAGFGRMRFLGTVTVHF